MLQFAVQNLSADTSNVLSIKLRVRKKKTAPNMHPNNSRLVRSDPERMGQQTRNKLESDDFEVVRKSLSFWAIIIGLGITMWLAALENSVITTAAPAILADIPMGDNWIWLTNAFFLASAAFQPLLGQLANLFGRRWTTLCVVAIFMIGSGVCGGATNQAGLIAGRAVQGIGSGGILMAFGMPPIRITKRLVRLLTHLYIDTIVSDLVPLRYRGYYIAIILMIYSQYISQIAGHIHFPCGLRH